jgi:hypothetical protein
VLFTLGILVLLGTFVGSLSNTRRTLHDRLARTVLVPR